MASINATHRQSVKILSIFSSWLQAVDCITTRTRPTDSAHSGHVCKGFDVVSGDKTIQSCTFSLLIAMVSNWARLGRLFRRPAITADKVFACLCVFRLFVMIRLKGNLKMTFSNPSRSEHGRFAMRSRHSYHLNWVYVRVRKLASSMHVPNVSLMTETPMNVIELTKSAIPEIIFHPLATNVRLKLKKMRK